MSTSANSFYAFQTARRIVSGAHAAESIETHLKAVGNFKSALIFTQPSIMKIGVVDLIVGRLAEGGISSEVITDIEPEPTVGNLQAIQNRIADGFDVYIGVGGGSVLDAVKIFSVLRTNDMTIEQMIGTDLIPHPGVPTVMIPTTSGTGSEVTPNAIVTFPEEELKIGIVSRHLLPELVILDPVLTLGLPPAITAATGMDAFTHSLESFISNKANPLSDMFALESIRLISRSILTAYREGSELRAREDMLLGSMLGGMALTGAGTAAVHALAYPLGGRFNIPHGVANSMLLPHVMEFNRDVITGRLRHVADAMGLKLDSNTTDDEASASVIRQIADWTRELNIPQNLEEFGVRASDVTELAVSASKVTRLLNNNPKQVTLSDMETLYRKLLPHS